MQIKHKYSRLERVEYVFTEREVQQALMVAAKVEYASNSRVDMDIDTGDEDNDYKLTVTLTQTFSHPDMETPDESASD